MWVWSPALLSGLRICRCCGCGVGQQLQLIGPLAWEPPYALGMALKSKNKQTSKQHPPKKNKVKSQIYKSCSKEVVLPHPHPFLSFSPHRPCNPTPRFNTLSIVTNPLSFPFTNQLQVNAYFLTSCSFYTKGGGCRHSFALGFLPCTNILELAPGQFTVSSLMFFIAAPSLISTLFIQTFSHGWAPGTGFNTVPL